MVSLNKHKTKDIEEEGGGPPTYIHYIEDIEEEGRTPTYIHNLDNLEI